MPLDESKKDFWDSFAEAGNARSTPSAIGTNAVKKTGGSGTGLGGAGGGKGKMDDDNWDKW